LYKLFGLSSLIILFTALFSVVNASSFADFKRTQTASFQTYVDERDNLYNNYLKSEWEAYLSQEPTPLYEKQKPADIKPARYEKLQEIGPKIDIYVKQLPMPEAKKQDDEISTKGLVFDYFGTQVEVNIPEGIR